MGVAEGLVSLKESCGKLTANHRGSSKHTETEQASQVVIEVTLRE